MEAHPAVAAIDDSPSSKRGGAGDCGEEVLGVGDDVDRSCGWIVIAHELLDRRTWYASHGEAHP